jgi:hypothetical protein
LDKLLFYHINTIDHKLSWVQDLLKSSGYVQVELHKRMSVRFNLLIEAQRLQITSLKQALSENDGKNERWKDFEKIEWACEDLFGEILAFLGGIYLRDAKLDQSMCQIADGLCSYLSERAQVYDGLLTIPALQDSFAGLTNLIRMRFPDFSLWGLPKVAHEFGHYLANERAGTTFPYLFGDILNSENLPICKGDSNWRILQEQFADLFAVYALGPAYAFSCIQLEFDPRQALLPQEGHPSYAERAFFLFAALQKMQNGDITGPFNWVISQLKSDWNQALQALGLNPITQNNALSQRLESMYAVLNDPGKQLAGVRYTSLAWSRAKILCGNLTEIGQQAAYSGKDAIQQKIKTILKAGDPFNLPDVFNAAWLGRLQDEKQTESISQMALTACQKILNL